MRQTGHGRGSSWLTTRGPKAASNSFEVSCTHLKIHTHFVLLHSTIICFTEMPIPFRKSLGNMEALGLFKT